ncbi:GNAT family N-acetyltransferase [Bacillus cereus]|nr:GNAT family N-acetyltransferase [Bacillus cereus]
MTSLKNVLELDFAYLETFTSRIEKSWGSIFCNESNPYYYDANHAHVCVVSLDPQLIVDEVIHFYKTKNIVPRFYIYNLDMQEKLISELQIKNFGFEELISPVQLWNKKLTKKDKNEKVTIEKVSELNFEEALDIECNIKEFGGGEVRKKAFQEEFQHPAFTHYLLRYNGVACSIACIFEHEKQARMESVATIEKFRGKGLIGELIHFIQSEVMNRGLDNLWVIPINEKVEKVYEKYGFETVEKIKTGHAFLEGKSIKEIHEG